MSFFLEIENLVSAKIEVVKTAVSILKLETRLAGLSVYPLLLNLCCLLIGLIGLWTSSMLAIGYVLELWMHNILLCILAVLFLHIVIVLGLIRYLSFNLKNMSFEKTRAYIANRGNAHVEPKKRITQRHFTARPPLALATNGSRRKKK